MDVPMMQIAKLELKAGETLVVMVQERLNAEQREMARETVASYLPAGVRALVLDGGAKLAKISAEAPDA